MLSKITEAYKDFTVTKNQKLTQKGFPMTRYPVPVKKNLDLVVDWKVDDRSVGYGLAERHEANGDCLIHFQSTFNRILSGLSHTFLVPKQTVVLAFAFAQFEVGRAPQEFVLSGKREIPEGAFFSYKMLSKYTQATYLNVGDSEYLAGFCYYPQLKGSTRVNPMFDETTVSLEFLRCESYQNVKERFDTQHWKQNQSYGRYCETAKERVIVKVPEGQNAVHFKYDFIRGRSFTTLCDECAEEFRAYKAAQATKKLSATVKTTNPVAASKVTPVVVIKFEKAEPSALKEKVEVKKADEKAIEAKKVEEPVEEKKVKEQKMENKDAMKKEVEVKKVEVKEVEEKKVDSDEEEYDFGN